mmetsp:Transcript_16982/g.40410  ORF Transcript_16982/g.40410 Transcript_16982/m.40410 type:complete len:236 (-) Transcript_16982:242-949(-)
MTAAQRPMLAAHSSPLPAEAGVRHPAGHGRKGQGELEQGEVQAALPWPLPAPTKTARALAGTGLWDPTALPASVPCRPLWGETAASPRMPGNRATRATPAHGTASTSPIAPGPTVRPQLPRLPRTGRRGCRLAQPLRILRRRVGRWGEGPCSGMMLPAQSRRGCAGRHTSMAGGQDPARTDVWLRTPRYQSSPPSPTSVARHAWAHGPNSRSRGHRTAGCAGGRPGSAPASPPCS